MAGMNFAEFQMKVLRGIGYNNISTTNRAYQWIKNNSSIDGPCLNYLKNYITEENFVTQKEMNLYKNILNNGQVPLAEEEVDKALEEFYSDDGPLTSNHSDINYIENELDKAETYLKELELHKRLLQRQHNKIQDEINVLKVKNQAKESHIETALLRAVKIDTLYDEASKKLQDDLNNIANTFHKLIDKDAIEEEHNVFRINFEIFRKINSTFRETVNFILEKQFGKLRTAQGDVAPGGNADTNDNFTNCAEDWKKAEDLIMIIHSLGNRTFENVMIKCEEAELAQLTEFLKNLKSEVAAQNPASHSGIACLQAQTSINDETIEDLKQKCEKMKTALEKYHKNNPLFEIFINEKFAVEQKFKNDRKCLRKISELCSKYIDLITLQACYLENEQENVGLAVDLYKRGIEMLEEQQQKHSSAMTNLEKLKNMDGKVQDSNPFLKFTLNLVNLVSSDPAPHKMIQKFPKAISAAKKKVISLVDDELREIQSLQTDVIELDKIVFNGPAKQPFYVVDLLADKRMIELQYAEFNKIYRGYKTKYIEEVEKLNNDEYLKMEKLLWITFLVDPQALQENFQNLRQSAGASRSLSLRRAENSMFALREKTNGTTYC